MKSNRSNPVFTRAAWLLGALLMVSLPAGAQDEAKPDPEDLVKKMSDFLAKAPRFTTEAEEIYDGVWSVSPRVQLTNIRTVSVERPNRFASDATGDTLNRSSWFDGKSLTVMNRDRLAYATLEMPGTIDGVLDKLAEDYGVVIPLSDFFYSDANASLTEGVNESVYLGVHQAAGVPCHHLVFVEDDLQLQLWIDAGAQPLPRKIAIAYTDQPGVPQYVATFRKWDLDPKFGPDQFNFKAPADAKKVDLEEVRKVLAQRALAGN